MIAGDTNYLNLDPIISLSHSLIQYVEEPRLHLYCMLDPIITTMSIYYAEPETKLPVNPERCSYGKTYDPFPAYDQKLLLQKGSYLYRQVQI